MVEVDFDECMSSTMRVKGRGSSRQRVISKTKGCA